MLLSDVTAGLVADGLPDGSGLVDLGRHRLQDLGRPERVWQSVHPDLAPSSRRSSPLGAFRHNLPVQLSPLIGRRREIAEVVDLLADERLVTLTGAGGVGKTRLALAVGAELVGAFPGGVWFVELAATGAHRARWVEPCSRRWARWRHPASHRRTWRPSSSGTPSGHS